MGNSNKKYDLKLMIGSIVGVILFAIPFFFFWNDTKRIIRIILESKFIYFIVWTLTIAIFLIHYFKHKHKELKSEVILTSKFGSFMDNAFGGITYGTAITTSLTLIKGLYIQYFFDDKNFFLEFQDMDLITVFGVMIFLLFFSIVKVVDIAKETYKIQNTQRVYTEDNEAVTIED